MLKSIILRIVGFFKREHLGDFPHACGVVFVFEGFHVSEKSCRIVRLLEILSENDMSTVAQRDMSSCVNAISGGSILYFAHAIVPEADVQMVSEILRSKLLPGATILNSTNITPSGCHIVLEGTVPGIFSDYRSFDVLGSLAS